MTTILLASAASHLYWCTRHLERAAHIAKAFRASLRATQVKPDAAEMEWNLLFRSIGAEFDEVKGIVLSANFSFDVSIANLDTENSVNTNLQSAYRHASGLRSIISSACWVSFERFPRLIDRISNEKSNASQYFDVLDEIVSCCLLARATLIDTSMRDKSAAFANLGVSVERCSAILRILAARYFVFLPSAAFAFSSVDNLQWRTVLDAIDGAKILRQRSAGGNLAQSIVSTCILSSEFPRSLKANLEDAAGSLSTFESPSRSLRICEEQIDSLRSMSPSDIFDLGLIEFLEGEQSKLEKLNSQIAIDFRFLG